MGRTFSYQRSISVWCNQVNNFEGTKPQVVNGQRLKHYMASDPINVDANMIYTRTHEEHVAAVSEIICFDVDDDIHIGD